jgi:uncharacterized protein YndB with AHSA1/START domain
MTVTTVDKDVEALTMTLVADFDAPVDRVWQLWADPRQLERWWGPPSHPATVQRHELQPGGTVRYFMTSPEGERYHGLWRVTAVDPPTSLAFEDAFADAEGNPNDAMPQTQAQVTLSERDGGTRMEIRSQFASREQMDQLLEMGMADGIQQAVGQIDAILAE